MDDMTAATKRTNSDGALKINHHTEHQVVTAARRRRMELMRLKVIANSGSQNAEPQDMLSSSTTIDNGLATNEVEEQEEESSTAISNTSIITKAPQVGSDESSGEICSMLIHNNCILRSSCSDSEINGAESPPEPQSITNSLASPQEESSVAGTAEQELLNNLDLQSMQSVSKIVALDVREYADVSSVV